MIRKGRPLSKRQSNHRRQKQGSARDDPTREETKCAPRDCPRKTMKSGHHDIRRLRYGQPKTQNNPPQKIMKMGARLGWRKEARAYPCQDQATELEQGQRRE